MKPSGSAFRSSAGIFPGIVVVAAGLHGWQCFYQAPDPAPGFFLWFMVPYLVAGLFLWRARSPVPAIAGASIALVMDLYMHDAVFIHPRGSTAALGLLFVPIWSGFLAVPLTGFLARFLVGRRRKRDQDDE